MNLTLHQFSKGYFFQKRPARHCRIGWLYGFVHSCKCFAVQNGARSQVRWLHTACWHWCIFSLTNQCWMGDDSTTSHVRTTRVSVAFSPPDYGWAGSAAGHPSKQVVPVPCGSCERAWDERLHGTQQALQILERLVFVCYVWCSPSTHSHVECNLICLLLWQKVFNRWGFG